VAHEVTLVLYVDDPVLDSWNEYEWQAQVEREWPVDVIDVEVEEC
jgi:hypothetical protein